MGFFDAFKNCHIPTGPLHVAVEGTEWCNAKVKSGDDVIVSLTPRNSYQKDNGWPEKGIVNINTRGASSTEYGNWIGYVPATHARKLLNAVNRYGSVEAHASIHRRKGELVVELRMPRDWK